MKNGVSIEFLSLFVKDIEESKRIYSHIFGASHLTEEDYENYVKCHPFAGNLPPAVFSLGTIKLALYQANGRTTHPGDLGIGLVLEDNVEEFLERVRTSGGTLFFGPKQIHGQEKKLAVFVFVLKLPEYLL